MLEAARPGRARVRSGLRVLTLLVLGGSAASAAALIYPTQSPRVEAARAAPPSDGTQRPAQGPVKVDARLAAASASVAPEATSAPVAGAVRQIPLIAGVDPTPPTPTKASTAVQQVAAPAAALAAQAAAPTASVVASSAKAPMDCLPSGLRTVLQDVQARFGTVTLVSTRELHTDNHTPGSARHKMHADCRAVDFKVEGDLNAVTAYLRTRPEVSGVNSYKNNRVIHIDAAGDRTIAQR